MVGGRSRGRGHDPEKDRPFADRMAGHEIADVHRATSLRLELHNRQLPPVASGDVECVACDLDDRAGLLRAAARTFQIRGRSHILQDRGGPTDDETGAVQKRVRMRPWIQSAYPVVDGRRGLRPVDQPFFLRQARRMGRARMILRLLVRRPRRDLITTIHQQIRA